ncbi:MAG: hypothetical protein K8R23_12500 [Chthoniobacter sp.]|nr:hypothetical protein [Chthoniobacter sp.]
MLGLLKQRLLQFAQSAAKELACPGCGNRFKPFAAAPVRSFSELARPVSCPQCGHTFRFNERAKARGEAVANPPGPHRKPADTKIEMVAGEGAWVYLIPRSRSANRWFFVFFAAVWNLVSWPFVFLADFHSTERGAAAWPLIALIPAVGLGLIYVALQLTFATYQLTLGPQTVRLRRKLLLQRTWDLPVTEITSVCKKEFYQQNYQPVFGIEITAGARRIRFGSQLSEEEKNWLCWQISEFARQRGALLT